MKVLIVDDEAMNRRILREAFEAHGDHEIIEAENGQEGLAAFLKHTPHVTITDLNMPFMNGDEMISEIRKKVPLAQIIMVSGSLKPNIPADVCFIPKPYNARIVIEEAIKMATTTTAGKGAALRGKPKHPSWTVFAQKEFGRWISFQRYFYDDEDTARAKYDELNQTGWVATLRRWHESDTQHMHLLDQEAMK